MPKFFNFEQREVSKAIFDAISKSSLLEKRDSFGQKTRYASMKTTSLLQLASLCDTVFKSHGLTIEETDSVLDYENRMVAIGKNPFQLPFDANRHVIPRHRTIGIILRSGGKDVAGVLARNLDLGVGTLTELLDDEARVLYLMDLPRRATGPWAREISGNVAYLGEMFITRTEPNRWRGLPGLSAAMVRYIMCASIAEWRLDWVYAFIKQSEVLNKNRVTQYGFSIQEQTAQDWHGVTDTRRDSREYLVANKLANFAHMADACIADPATEFPGFDGI